MKTIISITLCCLCAIVTLAQPESASYTNGRLLDSLRRQYRAHRDQRAAFETEWEARAIKEGNKELRAFTEVMAISNHTDTDPQMMEEFRQEIQTRYSDYPNVQAMAYQMAGYHYFIGEINYEKAFEAYMYLEKLLELYGPETITNYAGYYAEIASAYYKFRNYKKAIELDKQGVVYADNPWDLYNTIGLCFQAQHQPDSSIYYLQKAVDAAISKKAPDIYRTISLGNIGYAWYMKREYRKAMPLMSADLEGALRIGDDGLAAGAEIPMADIYLHNNNPAAAGKLLLAAREHIARSGQNSRLEKFFPVLSRYYQLMGDDGLALAYRDSAIKAIQFNDSVFNGLLVMRVQQRSDMEKLAEEKSKLENYKKLSQTRIMAVIALFVIMFVVFLVIRRYRGQIDKNRKRIEELNRTMELRQRLSADMHDDIGSTLSSISIYAHSLLMQAQGNTQRGTLEKIQQNAQGVQERLGDIIWSINPRMDSMEQIIARMRAFGADMTEHAGVGFSFEVEGGMAGLNLAMETRRNLYLIYKEAVNNAVKYSGCTTLKASIRKENEGFVMEIADDGIGFDTTKRHAGNGLLNMRRRAAEIKGALDINAAKEVGTRVIFRMDS